MHRRSFIFGALSAIGAQTVPPVNAQNGKAFALKNFPYELIATDGRNALATWERLKTARREVPIVVGTETDVATLSQFWSEPGMELSPEYVEKTIASAASLEFPRDLSKEREAECTHLAETLAEADNLPDLTITEPDGTSRTMSRAEKLDYFMSGCREDHQPPTGEWPAEAPTSPGLTVVQDWRTGMPYETVYIAMLPIRDPAAVPAYLRYGGWNANPPAEHHVAALRTWKKRYGAEIVGITVDTINIRTRARPASREEAIELAHAQYDYCADIVDQGVGDIASLAAMLMESDWWFFWWD